MSEEKAQSEIIIKNIDIPFFELAGFLVKLALATIPAVIVISFFYIILYMIYTFIIAVIRH